ncbi:TPA: hypothetical protein EYP70_07795 [Candidatus Bathyarchaeota archaeon]|nr:hypothetical protein [Candidatus Bathyarchaeota archaeon]
MELVVFAPRSWGGREKAVIEAALRVAEPLGVNLRIEREDIRRIRVYVKRGEKWLIAYEDSDRSLSRGEIRVRIIHSIISSYTLGGVNERDLIKLKGVNMVAGGS